MSGPWFDLLTKAWYELVLGDIEFLKPVQYFKFKKKQYQYISKQSNSHADKYGTGTISNRLLVNIVVDIDK